MEQLSVSSDDGHEIGNTARRRIYLDDPLEPGIRGIQLALLETARDVVDIRAPDNVLYFSEHGRVPVAFAAEVVPGAYTPHQLAAALSAAMASARCVTTHTADYTAPRHSYTTRLTEDGRLCLYSPSGGDFAVHASVRRLSGVSIKPLDEIRARLFLPAGHGLARGAPVVLEENIQALLLDLDDTNNTAIALVSRPPQQGATDVCPHSASSRLPHRLGLVEATSTHVHRILSLAPNPETGGTTLGLGFGPHVFTEGDRLEDGSAIVRRVIAPNYIQVSGLPNNLDSSTTTTITSRSVVVGPRAPLRGRGVRLWLERYECAGVRRPRGPRVFALTDPDAGGEVAFTRPLPRVRWIDVELTDVNGIPLRSQDWKAILFVTYKNA